MRGKKVWVLAGVVLALFATSIYINRARLRDGEIHIVHRPGRAVLDSTPDDPASGVPASPVLFHFNRKLALTEVKVFDCAEAATNSYPHALWHLVSDSNSIPTRGIRYGTPVPGMRPFINGSTADGLTPGNKYRLAIKAGSGVAQHDFILPPATH